MNRTRTARDKLRGNMPQVPQKSEEQIKYDKWENLNRKNIMVKNIQREIDFKEGELRNGIIETISIHRIPDGTAVRVDGYEDGKKPKFVIQNELDTLNLRKAEFEKQIEIQNGNTKTEGEASTK